MLNDFTAILASLTAFAVVSMLLPRVAEFAASRSLVGAADASRQIDHRRVPRLGGIAIWFGFLAAVATGLVASIAWSSIGPSDEQAIAISMQLAVLGGASVAVLLGFLDDLRPIEAPTKLLVQCLAALPVAAGTELTSGVGTLLGVEPWVAGVVAAVWIVFLMNAINLMDGLDGLAGGVVVIAAAFLVLLAGLTGWTLVVALALVGSLLGFLRYNLPPARVFMGDTGSLMTGYVLSVLALAALNDSPTAPRAMGIIVALGLPGLDAVAAFLRRSLRARNPFRPDADHLHHRLLKRADGVHARVTFTYYLMAITLGVFGLMADRLSSLSSFGLFFGVVALAIVLCRDLGYFDGSTYPAAQQGEDPARVNPLPMRRSWRVKPMPTRAAVRPRVDSPSNSL